jgi:hypothetical protein
MRHAYSSRRTRTASQRLFFAVLFFFLGLVGCDNSCFVFVSNPGGGIISGGTTNCSLNLGKGNVRPRITSSLAPAIGDEPAQIQHIFVTLRGIEANPNANADEESPDWQELAPKLATQPVQLDLLAQSTDSRELDAFGYVAVPADAYHQIRLRLSPNQPSASESIVQENSCGAVAFNCIVTSDGSVRPLALDGNLPEIQVTSDHITGGYFRVLPETAVDLQIEFNPHSSLFVPANEALRLVPVFTVDSQQTASEFTAAANQ